MLSQILNQNLTLPPIERHFFKSIHFSQVTKMPTKQHKNTKNMTCLQGEKTDKNHINFALTQLIYSLSAAPESSFLKITFMRFPQK